MAKHAWIARTTEEYKELGLEKGAPALWEDGLRTKAEKGNYEWWYFDSKLKNGANLVIVFYTVPMANFSNGFRPHATFTYTRPDGKRYFSRVDATPEEASYSTEQCDIQIGACRFHGNLQEYEIYWKDEKIEATIRLKRNVPSWRPHTGHISFNAKHFFAWLPSVPEGDVHLTVTSKGKTKHMTGTGYHDHNWGDVPMFFLMHHWYWGRAKIGDYQVVTSYITAAKKYNYDETPIFMLSKNGEILADEPEKYLTYSEEDIFYEKVTGKHVANRLIYDYDDGKQHYRITYQREQDIEKIGMETQVNKLQYIAIWLMGLRGSYHRVTGTATLEKFENETIVETVTSPALWELMYCGKDRIK